MSFLLLKLLILTRIAGSFLSLRSAVFLVKTIKKYMDERKNDKNNKVTKEEEKTGDKNFLDLMKYYQEVKKKEQIKLKNSIDDDARG